MECETGECDKVATARGLCIACYGRERRLRAPGEGIPNCSELQCGRAVHARGLCHMHYLRLNRREQRQEVYA